MTDPYDWLGIPKSSRPPTSAQLLDLPPTTSDASQIEEAFQRQARRLDLYRHGTSAPLAQKLLDELHQAKNLLLGLKPTAGWWNEAVPEEMQKAQPAEEDPEPELAGPGWWTEPPPMEKQTPPPPPIMAVPAPSKYDPIIDPPPPVKRSLAPLWIGLSILGCVGIAAGVLVMGQGIRDKSPSITSSNPELESSSKAESKETSKLTPTAKLDISTPITPPPEFFAMARPKVFRGHEGGVTAVAINNNASRIASVGTDKTLRLWSIQEDRSELRAKMLSEGVGVFFREPHLFACDGLTLYAQSDSKILKPRELESPRAGVHAVAISPDGQRALTGLNEGTLRLWTVTSGQHQEWSVGADKIIAVDIDRTGTTGLAITQGGIVSLWNLDRREKLLEWTPLGGAISGKLSPSGKQVAIGTTQGLVTIYDPAAKREIVSIRELNQPVTAIAWLSDDKRFLTVGVDETARLWSASSGKSLRWFQKLEGKGTSVAVDDRNRFAVVGTQSGVVHLLPLPLLKPDESIPPAAPPPPQPYSLPNPNQVAQAMASVKSSLASELAQARLEDVAILADNLLRRGLVEKVEPPLRYGLLQEARQLAIRADDSATARTACEGLITWFEVDPLQEYITTLEQLPLSNPTFTLQQALSLIDLAEAESRPEMVSRLTNAFLARLPEGLSTDLINRVEQIKQVSVERKELSGKVREAFKTLQTAPAEPNANLTYGKYLTLFRLDWTIGLPYLSRSSDAAYRETALADLADPKEPKDQIALGEKWIALAGQDKGTWEKRSLLSRAYYWLDKAAKTKLEFAEGVKLKTRLQEIMGQMTSPKEEAGIRPISSIVRRHHYNTLNEAVFANEWQMTGNVERAEGVRLKGEQSGLQSRFQLIDGSRLTVTIRPDGREMIFNCAGEEFRGSGQGEHYRITIERQGSSLRFIALDLDQGKTATKSFELTGAKVLPATVFLQLRGTSKKNRRGLAHPCGPPWTSQIECDPTRVVFMAFTAEISRTNPTCLLFLVDQSSSMDEPFGGQQGKKKSEGVADGINRLLQNLVLKCAKADGVRDYFHVGVIGYGKTIEPCLSGTTPEQPLAPISVIANNPIRLEQRKRTVDDGAGGLVEQSFRFPIWFEPVAAGKTPMAGAMKMAKEVLAEFLQIYPNCYPPMVLNLTDGKPTDENPLDSAVEVKGMKSTDGNVLLFNAHMSSSSAQSICFPSEENVLADKYAQLLFRMSSILPPKLMGAAKDEGYAISGPARGFVFNADLVSVIRFLNIGTRITPGLR